MKTFGGARRPLSAMLVCCWIWSAAAAQSPQTANRNYFTDVALVDQQGRQVRFYSDLLKDKVVVINAFFTQCEGVCPVMTGTFLKLQNWLDERLGRDVHLISMSVDPDNDTPERLKAYAERFGVKSGWHLISGEKENLKLALGKLGQYVEIREDHSNIFIIGNERTGLWKKAFGLADPEEIKKIIESVLNDGPGASAP